MSDPEKIKSEIIKAKQAMRSKALARRAGVSPELCESAGAQIAHKAQELIASLEVNIIGGYHPIKGELDCLGLMVALTGAGYQTALPLVTGLGVALEFRLWRQGEPLETGVFSVKVPAKTAAQCLPDLVLVPLLAFDAQGFRLGYGKGYYDRTLAQGRAIGKMIAIGLGFACQQIDHVPHDDHDQILDWIVTEENVIRL